MDSRSRKTALDELIRLCSYCSLVQRDSDESLYLFTRCMLTQRDALPADVDKVVKITNLARIFRGEETVEDFASVASLLSCVMNFPECTEFEEELEELLCEIEHLATLAAPAPALSTDLQQKGSGIIQKLVDKLPQPIILKFLQEIYVKESSTPNGLDLLQKRDTDESKGRARKRKRLASSAPEHQMPDEPRQGSSTSDDVGEGARSRSTPSPTTKETKIGSGARERKY